MGATKRLPRKCGNRKLKFATALWPGRGSSAPFVNVCVGEYQETKWLCNLSVPGLWCLVSVEFEGEDMDGCGRQSVTGENYHP